MSTDIEVRNAYLVETITPGTELVPVVDAEIVDETPPLTKDDAKKLDQRIRRMADAMCGHLLKLDELLAEAKAGDIHVALGYKSWTCYVADALGGRPELTASARKKMVTLLAGEGMSQRAIAQATGASKTTVKRDLDDQEVVHNGPADGEPASTVTGLDNKRHPRRKPAPVRNAAQNGGVTQAQVDKGPPVDPEASKPRRGPIIDDARRLSLELNKINKRLAKLADDDRLSRDRDAVGCAIRPEVARGLEVLGRIDMEISGIAGNSAAKKLNALTDVLTTCAGFAAGIDIAEVDELVAIQHKATILDCIDAIHDQIESWCPVTDGAK